MIRVWSWLLILGCLSPALFELEAAVFPLDVGPFGLQSGELDVARDPDFHELLVSIRLGEQREYLINLPDTAVYFARIRQQQKLVWQEAIFALLVSSRGERMPRLDWSPVPNARRYRIWISRPGIRGQWLETEDHAVHLNKIGAPWLIRLRAITGPGSMQPVSDLSFHWVGAHDRLPSPQPGSPVLPVQKQPAPLRLDPDTRDDDQTVYEPVDKDFFRGADSGPMDFLIGTPRGVQTSLKRHHTLRLWLRYLREQFTIDRQDRFEAEPSQGFGLGASGQYFLAPNLVLSGALDTHSTLTNYEAGGRDAPETTQKRVRVHVALGLDLLNTHLQKTDWSLNLGPVLGLVQMPLQQNEQKFTDYGFKLDGHHYPSGTGLSFLLLKSGSRELEVHWITPWTIWSLRPAIGAYHFATRQSAGAATGRFLELGLRLGIERDF